MESVLFDKFSIAFQIKIEEVFQIKRKKHVMFKEFQSIICGKQIFDKAVQDYFEDNSVYLVNYGCGIFNGSIKLLPDVRLRFAFFFVFFVTVRVGQDFCFSSFRIDFCFFSFRIEFCFFSFRVDFCSILRFC